MRTVIERSPRRWLVLVALVIFLAGSTVLVVEHRSPWWELVVVPISLGLGVLPVLRVDDPERWP